MFAAFIVSYGGKKLLQLEDILERYKLYSVMWIYHYGVLQF